MNIRSQAAVSYKFPGGGFLLYSFLLTLYGRHRMSGSRGVLLSPEIVDEEGRLIILHIEIQGSPYIIFNYYGPNDESSQLNGLDFLQKN